MLPLKGPQERFTRFFSTPKIECLLGKFFSNLSSVILYAPYKVVPTMWIIGNIIFNSLWKQSGLSAGVAFFINHITPPCCRDSMYDMYRISMSYHTVWG